MKKKKIELEKRIFILFFLITFLIVVVLILIEWQLAKYGIKQNEDINIRKIFSDYSYAQNDLMKKSLKILEEVASNQQILSAIRRKNYSEINKNISLYLSKPNTGNITIFNSKKDLLYGEKWDLTDRYIDRIFRNSYNKQIDNFFANYGNKIYCVSYKALFSRPEQLLCILINIENININNYNLGLYENAMLLALPLDESMLKDNKEIENRLNYLTQEITQMIVDKKSVQVSRSGFDMAFGLKIDYDIKEQPATVFIYKYDRDVYIFAQQSVLLFVIVLLAVTIMMISLLGNWFSKTISQPVKIISHRMQEIAANPSVIEPFEKNYRGVLGNMAETFNRMNKSLNEYSTNLKEYKEIADNLNSGIFWLDQNFAILLCNPNLADIFEQPDYKELLGKNFNSFVNLTDKQMKQALKNSISLHDLEIILGKKKKYVILKINSIQDDKGLKLVGNITDVTNQVKGIIAREALEMELIKSNKLAEIGRRVEGIVHNINSPLNTILGYAQLIKKENKNQKDIEKIVEAGKNIAHTVKGLLNKVRMDKSSMVRSVNINELINQELELCKHNLFFKHHVDLEVDLSDKLLEVKAVYGDISLCFSNLINNAIESLENRSNKFISVRTYQKENMVAIEIDDSVEGIKKENLELIFEPYFTTKKSKNSKGSGFGLGLAISKSIAEKYGGYIQVESQINLGSTFIIFLQSEK